MKNIKKIVAIASALALASTIALTAFAEDSSYTGDVIGKVNADVTADFITPINLTFTASDNGSGTIIWEAVPAADYQTKNTSAFPITPETLYTRNVAEDVGVDATFSGSDVSLAVGETSAVRTLSIADNTPVPAGVTSEGVVIGTVTITVARTVVTP